MNNNWDEGIQEDFDFMTTELGRECLVYSRADVLDYESQESSDSTLNTGVTEIVFMQELDSEHEMVAAGQMDVGDCRFAFIAASIAEEEGYVSDDLGTTMYKITKLTKVKGMSNDAIIYIKGFGRKVPGR